MPPCNAIHVDPVHGIFVLTTDCGCGMSNDKTEEIVPTLAEDVNTTANDELVLVPKKQRREVELVHKVENSAVPPTETSALFAVPPNPLPVIFMFVT